MMRIVINSFAPRGLHRVIGVGFAIAYLATVLGWGTEFASAQSREVNPNAGQNLYASFKYRLVLEGRAVAGFNRMVGLPGSAPAIIPEVVGEYGVTRDADSWANRKELRDRSIR
jgi:hypothetical protein